jgi:tetrahydromethanopterin S-methyltransferase subunit G
VSQSVPSNEPDTQKRRSTRIVQAIPLTVTGVDALGQPFKERTTTVMVNCHGCKYQSKHYVPKNSKITLEIPRPEADQQPRTIVGRVVWVQRPRAVRELFQIGLEFEVGGNVWGIAFPPEDWFPYAEDEAASAPAAVREPQHEASPEAPVQQAPATSSRAPSAQTAIPLPPISEPKDEPAKPAASAPAQHSGASPVSAPPAAPVAPPAPPAAASSTAAPSASAPSINEARGNEAKVHVMPSPAQGQDVQLMAARQVVKMIAEAKDTLEKTLRKEAQSAINEEMIVVRQQLDEQLHDTVERAIKHSMERVAESASTKIVQQAADRVSTIVEEARKAGETETHHLDAKIRETLDKALSEREAFAPARGSSEADESAPNQEFEAQASRTLQQWEERFQASLKELSEKLSAKLSDESARDRQLEAQAAGAIQQWEERFQATLKEVSERLSAKLSDNSAHESQFEAQAAGTIQQWEERFHATLKEASEKLSANLSDESARDRQFEAQVSRKIQQWEERFQASLKEASEKVSAKLHDDSARDRQSEALATGALELSEERLQASLAEASERLSAKLNEVSQSAVGQAEGELAARANDFQASIDQAIRSAQATLESMASGIKQEGARAEEIQARLDQASRATFERIQQNLDQAVSSRLDEVTRNADDIVAERVQRVESAVQNYAKRAIEQLSAEIKETLAPQLHEIKTTSAEIAGAEQTAANLRDQLRQATEQAAAFPATVREQIQHLADEAIQASIERIRKETERAQGVHFELQNASRLASEQMRQHLDEALSSRFDEINRRADEIVAERSERIEPMFQEAAKRAMEELSAELRNHIAPRIDEAKKAASELADAQHLASVVQSGLHDELQQGSAHLEELQNAVRDQAQKLSEEIVEKALERLHPSVTHYLSDFETKCRSTLSNFEEEFEQKSTETQHSTFEALAKAADWYQKKAQTTMQSTMEKSLEQSTAELRHRAAEISSMVASELDHYGRSYVEHSRAQMEEAVREVIELERQKLSEAAAMASATFTDKVHQTVSESLSSFEQSSRQVIEKSRSDMEYNREGSLKQFQHGLDERMKTEVENVHAYLQSRLDPLKSEWEAAQKAQQQAWVERLQKSTEESLTQYKERLENTSNSWMLASATTLGQSSQAVIDALARSAEERLRDTCGSVLAGMGDTLKDRLLAISAQFSTKPTEDKSSK